MRIDKEEIFKSYLRLGCSEEVAQELTDYEIKHRIHYMVKGHNIVKQVDAGAKEFNRKIKEKEKENARLLAFKKYCYENRVKLTRRYNHAKPVTDPDGIKYKTTSEMCSKWGVLLPTYCNRLAKGWSMYEALTGKRNNPKVKKAA